MMLVKVYYSLLKFMKKYITFIKLLLLRVNKYVVLNSLRMFIYKKILSFKIGSSSTIWAGNIFNVFDGITIGHNVIIGPNNVFLVRGGIDIGDNVNISGFSFFISQAHDVNDPDGSTTLKKIVICDNAWIATNATILPGVIIGQGAVVAAGSVVTKNVPPYTVVAGSPAVFIKPRNKDVRYRLNSTKGIQWL